MLELDSSVLFLLSRLVLRAAVLASATSEAEEEKGRRSGRVLRIMDEASGKNADTKVLLVVVEERTIENAGSTRIRCKA